MCRNPVLFSRLRSRGESCSFTVVPPTKLYTAVVLDGEEAGSDFCQCLEAFFGCRDLRVLLASSRERSGVSQQHMGSPTTKNYLTQDINSVEVKKL